MTKGLGVIRTYTGVFGFTKSLMQQNSIIIFFSVLILPAVVAEDYPLQKCIFNGNLEQLSALLESNNVAKTDKHGNTALHLAVMMGKKEFVDLLLDHNAPVAVTNLNGWTPLDEAVSYGNKETIQALWNKSKEEIHTAGSKLRTKLATRLNKTQDFYVEVKWDFHSWLPLISRLLPSDVCIIRKHGTTVRLDSTLIDLGDDLRWKRGDTTILFNAGAPSEEKFILMDNKKKISGRVTHVDHLMSNEIVSMHMSTKSMEFNKAKSGWIYRTESKEKMIGPYKSQKYVVEGMAIKQRKRREHLSEKDLQKLRADRKAVIRAIKSGGMSDDEIEEEQPTIRKSIPPPPPCSVTWKRYIESQPGDYPCCGRPMVIKETSRSFKVTVAMSTDFPLSVEDLSNLLDAASERLPKHLQKLSTFIKMRLPPGFPVELDIPLFLTVSAKITFQKFHFLEDVNEDDFKVPPHYREVKTLLDFDYDAGDED